MHTFRKADLDFDTGFHYVGNDPALHFLLNLVLSDPVEWNIFDEIDQVIITDGQKDTKKVLLEKGLEKWLGNLIKEFPAEEQKILSFGKKFKKSLILFGIFEGSKLILPEFVRKIILKIIKLIFSDFYLQPLDNVLADLGFVKNSLLYTVLCA